MISLIFWILVAVLFTILYKKQYGIRETTYMWIFAILLSSLVNGIQKALEYLDGLF